MERCSTIVKRVLQTTATDDATWQLLGVVLAFASIVVSLVIYSRQRLTKRLQYVVRTATLLTVDSSIRSHVQVTYDGREIRDLAVLDVRFLNTGSLPVRPEDFVTPIGFSLRDGAELLSAEVVESSPHDLGVRCEVPKTRKFALVHPLLLNRGDGFVLRCLLSGPPEVYVSARIVGISRIDARVVGSDQRSSSLRPSESSTDIAPLLLYGGLYVLLNVLFGSLPASNLLLIPLNTLFLFLLWRNMRRRGRAAEKHAAA
jgi:hypothetical protein